MIVTKGSLINLCTKQ